MAGRRVVVILTEIIAAIDGIEAAVKGKTESDLADDWLLRHGVERGLEIISEASRHLPAELVDAAPEIEWKKLRGVGNILRHEYHKVSTPIVWRLVIDGVPPLRVAVERMRRLVEDR